MKLPQKKAVQLYSGSAFGDAFIGICFGLFSAFVYFMLWIILVGNKVLHFRIDDPAPFANLSITAILINWVLYFVVKKKSYIAIAQGAFSCIIVGSMLYGFVILLDIISLFAPDLL
ncbi:MAG: hypothetical protein ABIY70_08005 [Capsulimonas sp.]|uniref:hypothetical protein n=1 Tax=Capsulimonas sp. TaxID=2494211 RepID=UPI003267D6F3